MPRVNNVNACRISPGKCSKCGTLIEKGQPYRWWKFMRGGKFIRCNSAKCLPRPSDLTRSDFWKAIYSIQEEELFTNSEEFESDRDTAVSDLQNIRDETQEKLDNMPQGLQEGDTGQLLQERIDALESAIETLEGTDLEIADDLDDSQRESRVEEISSELSDALQNISCS